MARQYYYLIASLPNLIFEHEAKGFDFLQLKNTVRESLHPADYRLVKLLFAPIDNQNVLSKRFNEHLFFLEGGELSEEQLNAEKITEELDMPAYFVEFLDEIAKQEDEQEDSTNLQEPEFIIDPETLLARRFYAYVEKLDNKFIREWFRFDRELRNIQAAIVARKLGVSVEDYLVGDDDITELLLKNNSSDFGLRRERDYIDKLWQVFETNEVLEREKKMDLLRWSYIDEITTFDYFDVNAVLAFMQKAYIINRWMKLDTATGIAMFEQLVSELKESYDAKEAFKGVN